MANPNDPAELVRQCRKLAGKSFGIIGLFSGVINITQLTVPLFLLQVHDRILSSRSIDSLKMLAVISILAILLYGILEYARALAFQAVAAGIIGRLNVPAIHAALAQAVEQGTSRGTETLRDLSELRTFLTSSSFSAPFEALWCPVILAILFAFHPIYGLIGIGAIVLLIALGLLSDLIAKTVLKEANAAQVESYAMIGGVIRHSEVVEGMGMVGALTRRWLRLHSTAVDLLYHGTARSKGMHALTRASRYLTQIGILGVGASLIINGEASPGSMIGGTMIIGRLLMPFDTITADWRAWVFAGAAWRRVRDILEERRSPRETQPSPRPLGDLVVDRLVYAPAGSSNPIIRGLSFTASPGEVIGIAGPSAAGKSTLARLLVGVLRPNSGGAFLDGHNVYLWERESFGDVVGYLPQSVSLIDGTIRENISRFREADPREVIAAARAAGVHETIGRLPLGYDTPVSEAAFTLSGGQKQRLALARALFGRPALMVLDEPNSNLDVDGENALVTAISQSRSWGAIVIIIAHRQSVMRAADRILIMQEGRIIDTGQVGPETAAPRAPTRRTIRSAKARRAETAS
jgi:ATP-binding cassette subfamily C protein